MIPPPNQDRELENKVTQYEYYLNKLAPWKLCEIRKRKMHKRELVKEIKIEAEANNKKLTE